MSTREELIAWIDQFPDDHYIFDIYGEQVTCDLPRQTVEKVLDIAILLVDRVVAEKGKLRTAEYEYLEQTVREKYPEEGAWLMHVIMAAVRNEYLFGPYKDIEPMISKLMPKGYPMDSAAYLLMIRPEIHKLIYAIIRQVDDVEENYESWVYSFFAGVLTKGWGEGFGWSKTEDGNWIWKADSADTKAAEKPKNENTEC